jgi:hypothetical protein
MIEGSGSGAGFRSGSIPLTSGFGSRGSKNMWIRCSGSGDESGTLVSEQGNYLS